MFLKIINKKIITLFFIVFLALPVSSFAVCEGEMMDIVNEPNWSGNMDHVVIGGVKIGKGKTTILHRTPVMLKCPHQMFPGVGIAFNSPDWVYEVTKEPMCLLSLPKVKLSKAYDVRRGVYGAEGGSFGNSFGEVKTLNHPLFVGLKLFNKFLGCLDLDPTVAAGGIGVRWMSEFDITHSNPLWSIAFAPETVLFATPAGQLSCIPDGLAAALGQPLTPLFWCQGQRGVLPPFSGWTASAEGATKDNMTIIEKNLAQGARMFRDPSTVGPWAQCMAIPIGILTKEQYLIDPSTRHQGAKIEFGAPIETWALPNLHNTPNPKHGEDTRGIIWRKIQCSISK